MFQYEMNKFCIDDDHDDQNKKSNYFPVLYFYMGGI